MDMLKRPEAAELKDTGRFYLQVGYNEFFALGQSAWAGADYEPQNEVVVQRDDSIQLLDVTGQTVLQDKPKVEKARSDMK
jgi:S-DNA-T family DNA segregation ATPase FtsK/SpoIIIE